ncbi:MAG: 5-(carboxyamino)imidazole ribonucleotide mutase [Planctomycetaceae bacterium]|nr:5-(carboxyamino)imidazole ribonucleotide mutase [Planctomycetaceae bacterium]
MAAKSKAIVGVVMGSDSDLETMKRCLGQLDELGVTYEVRVLSAHRTPDEAHQYAAAAAGRGLKVIIAAAGMSAALAGVMAAGTTLPVIGVPMDNGSLNGLDAALSTMQMPPGVPVGCMAIGAAGATNAAVYAAAIIALGDKALARKLAQYKSQQRDKVLQKDAKVQGSL